MENERQRQPQPEQPHTFENANTSVTIVNPAALEKRLEKEGASFALFHGDRESLPEPCRDATISYEHDMQSDEFFLSADTTFALPPEEMRGEVRSSWQIKTINHLRDMLEGSGASVLMLPHHFATLYTTLDETYAVQFTLVEDTHTCGIAMKLERINEICEALGKEYDPPVTEETPRYTLAHDFIAQWNIVLSSVKTLYGNPRATDTIAIHIPEPIDTIIETSKPLELTSLESRVTFDDIGGATAAKNALRPLIHAFNHPDLAARYGVSPSSFMLHGPAGTGKTSLVQAFAQEIGAELREFASNDIVTKWVGGSGKKIAEIFADAKQVKSPLVLFFDEFDSIAPAGDVGTTERQDVKNIFKRELSALAARHPNIVVAAATNKSAHEFDEALVRAGRLTPIYVPIPTDTERQEIWGVILWKSLTRLDKEHLDQGIDHLIPDSPLVQTTPLYADDIDPVKLAAASDGLTGADIELVLQRARMNTFTRAAEAGQMSPITHADILAEIRTYQKP